VRSSRTIKNKNRKVYIKYLLLAFLLIIPVTAIISGVALHLAVSKDKSITLPAAIFTPKDSGVEAFKYNFDVESRQLYRVELQKFDRYQDAEAQIAALKKKKLNGFIIKEQGYVNTYGLFWNKSQADTAAKFLKRKNIESTVQVIDINGINVKYSDVDKTLIDLATAVDAAVLKVLSEKSALSLESLYSDKKISDKSLVIIIEQETKLAKYLNYVKDLKTSEANSAYREKLENLVYEVLVDKLQVDESYDYYSLQNSLMNQGDALIKFYEKLSI
jgi:hypothetical protein